MKKINKVVFLMLVGLALSAGPRPAMAEPIAFETQGGTKFILPLQVVNGIQLYSFSDKKGYPGLEAVLVEQKNFRLNFGAAAVLGQSENVPFVSLETRLSEKFFQIDNNNLYFGVWVGQESHQKKATWGLAASIPLW